MNLLDFILLILLALSVAFGWRQGFFLSFFETAGLAGGIYIGTLYSKYPVSLILRYSDLSSKGVSLISFLVILVVVILVLRSIGIIVNGIFSILPGGKVLGSALGAALGLARGIILAGLVITIVAAHETPKDLKGQIEGSRFAGTMEGMLPRVSKTFTSLVTGHRDIYPELEKGLEDGFAPQKRRKKDEPPDLEAGDSVKLETLKKTLNELPKKFEERNRELEKLLKEAK